MSLSVYVILIEILIAILIAWVTTPKDKRITNWKQLVSYLSEWFDDEDDPEETRVKKWHDK